MEKYFYGQGKIFLAKRNKDGTPQAARWVGDVSEFNFELSTEDASHKESYSGQKATVRKFNIGKDGSLSLKMHDHSPENLSLVLYGHQLVIPAGMDSKTLPAPIKAGERYTLGYLNISNTDITGLTASTDYIVDEKYGAIDFLTDQTTAPVVDFDFAAQRITPMFNKNPDDVYLRYEGINLAENGEPVVAEFYKVQISPTTGMDLINNDSSLAGLPVKASILYDSAQKVEDPMFGRYGRILMVD